MPALFNCAGGKDRTGVTAALLLGLAGVPDEVIAEDYSLSGWFLVHRLEEGDPRSAEEYQQEASPRRGMEIAPGPPERAVRRRSSPTCSPSA